MDDSDVETELYLEDFSRELKGNIILTLYTDACADRSLVEEPVAGDTAKMWERIRQVASNDPVGSYFLSTSGGIGARMKTEETMLDLLVQMLVTEDFKPLSTSARQKWTDEMCERTEWYESDDDEEDDYGLY